MRILILGDQRSQSRFNDFPDAEFFSDPDPALGPYDYVVLDHLLQQASRPQVMSIVKMYADTLVDGGQMAIVVPSLEWACKEIAKEQEPNPMAYLSIYGTDEEPYLCGMTILWMRLIMEQVGLTVIKANVEHYIATINGQQFQAQQNLVIAMKISSGSNPSLAFASREFVETLTEA